MVRRAWADLRTPASFRHVRRLSVRGDDGRGLRGRLWRVRVTSHSCSPSGGRVNTVAGSDLRRSVARARRACEVFNTRCPGGLSLFFLSLYS